MFVHYTERFRNLAPSVWFLWLTEVEVVSNIRNTERHHSRCH